MGESDLCIFPQKRSTGKDVQLCDDFVVVVYVHAGAQSFAHFLLLVSSVISEKTISFVFSVEVSTMNVLSSAC